MNKIHSKTLEKLLLIIWLTIPTLRKIRKKKRRRRERKKRRKKNRRRKKKVGEKMRKRRVK